MALLKLGDFDPNYRETFNGGDVKGMAVYTDGDEKIGTVNDVLVDEEGHFRYFIVDLGFWIFGKKVMLPVGRSRVDHNAERVYAVGMTREQADNLPEFNERDTVDYDYEERVRGVYRTPGTGGVTPIATASVDAVSPINTSAPLEASAPLDAAYTASMTGSMANQPIYAASDEASAPEGVAYPPAATADYATYNRDTYTYKQEPSLYDLNDRDHQTLKLYQERLIANKKRVKTGEVTVGKHIETETARVSVPIEKERVVIERVTPADAGQAVAPGSVDFREGEVAHVEIYEETPDIKKEAFVREEVKVTKVVEQETASAQETIRREELDVKTDGQTVVDRQNKLPNDRI